MIRQMLPFNRFFPTISDPFPSSCPVFSVFCLSNPDGFRVNLGIPDVWITALAPHVMYELMSSSPIIHALTKAHSGTCAVHGMSGNRSWLNKMPGRMALKRIGSIQTYFPILASVLGQGAVNLQGHHRHLFQQFQARLWRRHRQKCRIGKGLKDVNSGNISNRDSFHPV